MKNIPLKLGSIGGITGIATLMAIGLTAPEPAGACSCAMDQYDLEITEVRLMNPGDLDDTTLADMEAEEAAAWPETASFDERYAFEGHTDDDYITIMIKREQ